MGNEFIFCSKVRQLITRVYYSVRQSWCISILQAEKSNKVESGLPDGFFFTETVRLFDERFLQSEELQLKSAVPLNMDQQAFFSSTSLMMTVKTGCMQKRTLSLIKIVSALMAAYLLQEVESYNNRIVRRGITGLGGLHPCSHSDSQQGLSGTPWHWMNHNTHWVSFEKFRPRVSIKVSLQFVCFFKFRQGWHQGGCQEGEQPSLKTWNLPLHNGSTCPISPS